MHPTAGRPQLPKPCVSNSPRYWLFTGMRDLMALQLVQKHSSSVDSPLDGNRTRNGQRPRERRPSTNLSYKRDHADRISRLALAENQA